MNILVIHAHTSNRGDESAVKAMVDELLTLYPDASITICLSGTTPYPNMPEQVTFLERFPRVRKRLEQLEFLFAVPTNAKFVVSKNARHFFEVLKNTDLVIHAPGGPSIGDIYAKVELLYLWRLDFIRKRNIPYMFYAPSMGPFTMKKRNKLRKKILLGAERVIVRDPISLGYLHETFPQVHAVQTLDSAFQHDVNLAENEGKFNCYGELKRFVQEHPKCIGITISDLTWHPSYKDSPVAALLPETMHKFIASRIKEGYGIVFIPQLYGANNDTIVMAQYMEKEHTFMVDAFDDRYDSYFQQYLIGKLYAVVGMRYHSNIFSAKMGTPFVSISYEQKMKGFMESVNLSDYCIDVEMLSGEILEEYFQKLLHNYDSYKARLQRLHPEMKMRSYQTTHIVAELLNELGYKEK